MSIFSKLGLNPKQLKAGIVILLVLAALTGLYFYLMKPSLAGFLYDDGMYLMAGKALVSGQGYHLTGIEAAPFFYKYPPFYPLLLGIFWKINPQFPKDIPWLKSLNIVLSIATLGLLAYYYRRIQKFPLWLCAGLIAIIGTNWRLIEVTIEMMSEPLFMALATLSIILAHCFSQKNTPLKTSQLLILMGLSVTAFYTRTMGLTLIAALSLWFWLLGWRKQSVFYSMGCFGALLPWFIWSASRKDTTYAVGDFLVRTFQETYFQSFKMDLRYEYTLPEMVINGIRALLGNLSVQFFPLLERFFLYKPTVLSESVILGLSFGLALLLGGYAYRQLRQRHFTVEGLFVLIYLLILPFWSFYKAYPRFWVPLLPFAWAFLMQASQAALSTNQRRKIAVGLLMALALSTNLIQLLPYLAKNSPNPLTISSTQVDLWQSYKEVFKYIQSETPADALIYPVDNKDEGYFWALNSQRQAFDFFLYLPNETLAKACVFTSKQCLLSLYYRQADALLTLLKRYPKVYMVSNRFQITKNCYNSWQLTRRAAPTTELLLLRYPRHFTLVNQSTDGLVKVYRLNP